MTEKTQTPAPRTRAGGGKKKANGAKGSAAKAQAKPNPETAAASAPEAAPAAPKARATKSTAAKTAPKSTTRNTTGAKTKRGKQAPAVTPEQRYAMIAEAAYFIAEKNGFDNSRNVEFWLEAEAQIDAQLAGR